jgi:hypothetical protein
MKRSAGTGDEFLLTFPKQRFPDRVRFERLRHSTAAEPDSGAYNKR